MSRSCARTLAAVLLAVSVALAACRREPPAEPSPDENLPPPAPVGVNEISALAARGEKIWLGTSDGIVLFVPATASWTLWRKDGDVSMARVTSIDVAPDGSVWSGHASAPAEEGSTPAPPVAGGVRAVLADGSVQAFFAGDGLPSDDVVAIAAGEAGVSAATRAGLAVLATGASRFEAVEAPARRRVTLLDAASGGAPRSVTEFRPRDERILSLAQDGSRLWIGTSHGLLAREGSQELRLLLPACRPDGQAADAVTALAVRPGSVLAALGLVTEERDEPSGIAEIAREGSWSRCHVPGRDVPAGLIPGLAADETTAWLATYEGLIVMRGESVTLLERGLDLPALPPMSVAADGEGGAWIGFWGAGLGHLRGQELTTWRFGSGDAGTATRESRTIAR